MQYSAQDRVVPVIVGFDFGTSFSSVSYCREPMVDGEIPKMIECLAWKVGLNAISQVPSQVAWNPDEERWEKGSRVDVLIADGTIRLDDVFTNLKLALNNYPQYSEIHARHLDQLSRTRGWVKSRSSRGK